MLTCRAGTGRPGTRPTLRRTCPQPWSNTTSLFGLHRRIQLNWAWLSQIDPPYSKPSVNSRMPWSIFLWLSITLIPNTSTTNFLRGGKYVRKPLLLDMSKSKREMTMTMKREKRNGTQQGGKRKPTVTKFYLRSKVQTQKYASQRTSLQLERIRNLGDMWLLRKPWDQAQSSLSRIRLYLHWRMGWKTL